MRRIAAAGLILFAVACSSATTSAKPRTGSNRNVITYEEIQSSRQAGWTAWDMISTLRPLFLKSRGMTSLGNPSAGISSIAAVALVYVVPVGGHCEPQQDALDLTWLSPEEAASDDVASEMAGGQHVLLRQALAHCGALS